MKRTALLPAVSTSAPRRRRGIVLAALLAAPLALAACGSTTPAGAGAAPAARGAATTPAGETGHASGHAHALTLDSAWVKAGSGMTAAFGTISNPTDHDVTIVQGSSPAAGAVALHTTEKQADGTMTMTEKKAGFVVPANGSLTLSPGGDHIMLMGLTAPLSNGQDVAFSMVSSDGEVFDWTVPVRSFAGADETYAPDGATDAPTGTPTDVPTMHDMAPTTPASS
jgi:copper(I)-binding protein